jgi:catechol 2,3-dioxygenase-like lactoylglutathione lyase family enzyme
MAEAWTIGAARLRIARPTDQMSEIVRFYRDGLGFEVLSSFEDHDGFDGVMLGQRGAAYHLEFTHRPGHKAGKGPSEDNLLVFYLPEEQDWQAAVDRMHSHGYQSLKAANPY